MHGFDWSPNSGLQNLSQILFGQLPRDNGTPRCQIRMTIPCIRIFASSWSAPQCQLVHEFRGRSWVCGVCGGAAGLHGPGAERWHTGSLRETPVVQARAASCCRAAAPLLHRRARRARGGGELWQSCRRPRTFLRSLGTHMLDAPLQPTHAVLANAYPDNLHILIT